MSFGERIKYRRGELKLSRADLAERLGVSPSAVSNYENGVSFPKEDVMLRLFDSLETEPNVLFQDSYRGGGQVMSGPEQALLRQYRGLSPMGRESVRSVVEALCSYRDAGRLFRLRRIQKRRRGADPFHGGGICPVRHPLQCDQSGTYPHGSDTGHMGSSHPRRLSAGTDRHGPSRRAG